jgi:hypothetical protein
MSEKQIQVPSEMLDAAVPCYLPDRSLVRSILESALRWLSENPIVPNTREANILIQERIDTGQLTNSDPPAFATVKGVIEQWLRRMFLAPEPTEEEEDRRF